MTLPTLTIQEVYYEYQHRHDNKKVEMAVVTGFLCLASIVAVVLRFWSRKIQGVRFGWSDWTILFALAMASVMCAIVFLAIAQGMGTHIIKVGETNGFHVAQCLYLLETFFPIANTSVKISILLLYHSIFGGTHSRTFTRSLRTLGFLWSILAITGTCSTALQCWPVQLAWTSDHSHGCLNLEKMILSLTIFSVFLNAATLVLPMPLIWGLHLSRRRKFGVALLFMLGGGDVAVSIVRAVSTKEISTTLIDFTWKQCETTILGLLEPCIAIVCACIPVLPPVFRKVCSKKGSNTPGSNSPNHRRKRSSYLSFINFTKRSRTSKQLARDSKWAGSSAAAGPSTTQQRHQSPQYLFFKTKVKTFLHSILPSSLISPSSPSNPQRPKRRSALFPSIDSPRLTEKPPDPRLQMTPLSQADTLGSFQSLGTGTGTGTESGNQPSRVFVGQGKDSGSIKGVGGSIEGSPLQQVWVEIDKPLPALPREVRFQ